MDHLRICGTRIRLPHEGNHPPGNKALSALMAELEEGKHGNEKYKVGTICRGENKTVNGGDLALPNCGHSFFES